MITLRFSAALVLLTACSTRAGSGHGDTTAGGGATTDTVVVAAVPCLTGGDPDTIQVQILATSGICGALCLKKADPNACANACVREQSPQIGPACVDCFGELSLCAAEHCFTECATAPNDACAKCGVAHCLGPFQVCYDMASAAAGDPSGDADATSTADGASTTLDTTNGDTTGAGHDASGADDVSPDGDASDCPTGTIWYPDNDGDGFGDSAYPSEACPLGYPHVAQGGDCDDDAFVRHPGAIELPNLLDDNCDGSVDEALWKRVSAGYMHTCGLLRTDEIRCWGYTGGAADSTPPGAFTDVSAGWARDCAARKEGGVVCWGANTSYYPAPESGEFVRVSAGLANFSCGLMADGTVTCWGTGVDGAAESPSGAFLSVSAGNEHTCVVATDGALVCYGFAGNWATATPGGVFDEVGAGESYGCALRHDGHILCWGSGLQSSPGALFVQVAAGVDHACAVTADTRLYCWGYDSGDGRTAVPDDESGWEQVSAGGDHSCAVRGDGAIRCWGNNDHGQVVPTGGLKP